jgi:hypothetical protein
VTPILCLAAQHVHKAMPPAPANGSLVWVLCALACPGIAATIIALCSPALAEHTPGAHLWTHLRSAAVQAKGGSATYLRSSHSSSSSSNRSSTPAVECLFGHQERGGPVPPGCCCLAAKVQPQAGPILHGSTQPAAKLLCATMGAGSQQTVVATFGSSTHGLPCTPATESIRQQLLGLHELAPSCGLCGCLLLPPAPGCC